MIFKFNLGGYFATNYRVNYRKGELHCYASNYPYPPLSEEFLIVPLQGNEDWIKLLNFLSDSKWKNGYQSFVEDGIQWELKVKDTGISIKSFGSNAYPNDFDTFLDLLNNAIITTGIKIPLVS